MQHLTPHITILDPLTRAEDPSPWLALVPKLGRCFLDARTRREVFEITNALVASLHARHAFDQPIGDSIRRVLRRDLDRFHVTPYLVRVSSMLAVLHVLHNTRLQTSNAAKRETLAIALWSSLTFQSSLPEPRVEKLRGEILRTAQELGLGMARRERARRTVPVTDEQWPPPAQHALDALRHNATLDQEENGLLRWFLPEGSELSLAPRSTPGKPNITALLRTCEMARLFRLFPTTAHYNFVVDSLDNSATVSLRSLRDALSDDAPAIAEPYRDNPLIRQCPFVFPLLASLLDQQPRDLALEDERPMAYWCGRVVLEVAALQYADADLEKSQ